MIPANPRTEPQQNNRAIFSVANRLAQEAYNINKGSPLWDTSTMGQYPQLVSTAKKRLQRGLSETEALPLYPDGFTPNIILGNVSTNWGQWPLNFYLQAADPVFNEPRTMATIVHWKNEITGHWEDLEFDTLYGLGSFYYIRPPTNGIYSIPAGSTVIAASADDASHGGASVYLPEQFITQPSLPPISIPLTIASPIYDPANQVLYFDVTGSTNIEDGYLDMYYHYYDPDSSSWEDDFSTLESDGIDSGFYIDTSSYDKTFPNGSYIAAGSQSQTTASAVLNFSWPQKSFSWP